MKQIHDKGRTEREFMVSDWVYLKLQPYRQNSVALRQSNKLAPKFYGPFQIQERIGSVAYAKSSTWLKDLSGFPRSLLKKKLGDTISPYPTLPPLDSTGFFQWLPEKILDRGMFKRKNVAVTKWLIKWTGLPNEDATWKVADDIIARYLDFQTWGQVSS